ncbi:MAG: BMP family ABC transporter substrate-binding protein [Clostridia bacterium]|nr:BMP family ABC transporter substrate-binding protein [Clostridia bacterium]
MKKILALVLVLALCLTAAVSLADPIAKENIKLGVITLHGENSTYDANFINAVKEACAELGLEEGTNYVIVSDIEEADICRETALDLVDEGCNIIFADSFGHEDFIIEAAKEHPEVEFCHATGTKAHTENLANFHNAFAAIYEGRYLAGVAAGMKLEEIKAAGGLKGEVPMIGYVGAFPYAEVKSGYTSFYLGARSVCPDVIMKVQFTGSWYDETGEKTAAEALIALGADLISQHADSMGAPKACEAAGIPDVSYNGSTVDLCPNTFIVASKINWVPYFKYIIEKRIAGEAIDTDWTGTIATGSVELTDVNEKAAAAGTVEKIAEVKAQFEAGTLHVYDTATWTKGGAVMESYLADVDTDAAFTPDTEAIVDGYFAESTLRSAPYFDIDIDGIEIVND